MEELLCQNIGNSPFGLSCNILPFGSVLAHGEMSKRGHWGCVFKAVRIVLCWLGQSRNCCVCIWLWNSTERAVQKGLFPKQPHSLYLMDFVPLILLWLSLTGGFLQQQGWMFSFDKQPDVFSSLREVTESWAGYLTANLMALGLLRRFLILWVFPCLVGTVNSCPCFPTCGAAAEVEAEVCALQNSLWCLIHRGVQTGKPWSLPVLSCSTRQFARSCKGASKQEIFNIY